MPEYLLPKQGNYQKAYENLKIAKNLDGLTSDEVTLSDARQSLEFVTAVYDSSNQGKNITMPIKKENPLYKSWIPKNK